MTPTCRAATVHNLLAIVLAAHGVVAAAPGEPPSSATGPTRPAARPAASPTPRPSPSSSPSPSPSAEETLARSMTASAPGPQHRWLEPLVGIWTVDLTLSPLKGKPLHLTGTSENEWLLGGRFLRSEYQSADADGTTRLDGVAVYGYDGWQKRFFGLILDNHSSYYLPALGTYDPAAHVLILSGKERDELTGVPVVRRQRIKIEGPDRYVLEVFYDRLGRSPFKLVEAVFTRRTSDSASLQLSPPGNPDMFSGRTRGR